MSDRILITGAFGKVGTALLELPGELVLYDQQVDPSYKSQVHTAQGLIQDRPLLEKAMRGCRAVVHLAATPEVNATWENVLRNNILGTQRLLEVAREAGVERVIFASSSHVVGMVELENYPAIYEAGHGIMVTKDAAHRPDSYYGVSKAFGEDLGRYVAEKEDGPRFYALRIGGVHAAPLDHPYSVAEGEVAAGLCARGDKAYELIVKRQKAIWLSRRDLFQLVWRCLEYDGPLFDIFYGVSNNDARWLDIEYAKKVLGYRPQDNGTEWTGPPAAEGQS
jgi:nucleoside-diphosphate-sugar epimerase